MDLNEITSSSRPLANYHPNVWGDRFLLHEPEFTCQAGEKQLVEELKEEVRRELKEASNDYLRQLKMVDAIQRLGIEYLFEEEIDEALRNLLAKFENYCKDNHDMYATALSFRLLRQHGYKVSCEVFDKFKDGEDGFKVEEVMAVLELFEATHMRIHGEDVLDQAFVFTRNYLQSIHATLSNPIAKQVHNALNGYSCRRGMPRIEARKYIPIYEEYGCHHKALLKLAKLDFNLLQSMHKRELTQLYRWWKDLEMPTKLPYIRDRLVETYFWDMGFYFEPQYALARNILVKVQCLVSIFDDTFDAYGAFKELQLFKDAIDRWSISCLDELPEYMQIIYKLVLDVFEEIESHMIKQGTSYRLDYAREAIKIVIGGYFDEAKWREEEYKPRMEEYMKVATKSAAYLTLIIVSFVGMKNDIATPQAFQWVLSEPQIITASLALARLSNDLVGIEFEKERKYIATAVELYEEEHKVSKEEAVLELRHETESAWKEINEALLEPTTFATPILDRILNSARVLEVFYDKTDRYTHVDLELQNIIAQLYIHPIP
uniref:Germacrene D synthase 1 n=1 Tax=Pogostemon cablin TaxID=28511 RepID=TPGD1_POGCB|nr:RecName: Full=Germacrene D synthase 1; AltName: Full=PatTpsB15 [Pogostemon cablin]AAS86322.1 germacrene D synthase [Pogostemon cablin]